MLSNAMPGVEDEESELRGRLQAILHATPPLMQVLSVARGLYLPDWLVFFGRGLSACTQSRNRSSARLWDQGLRPRLFRGVRPFLRSRGCGDSPGESRFR
jgi:hypothetical protein